MKSADLIIPREKWIGEKDLVLEIEEEEKTKNCIAENGEELVNTESSKQTKPEPAK